MSCSEVENLGHAAHRGARQGTGPWDCQSRLHEALQVAPLVDEGSEQDLERDLISSQTRQALRVQLQLVGSLGQVGEHKGVVV